MRAEIPTAHSRKVVCASSSQFCRCVIGRIDRCGSPCERVLAADDAAVLDHALHADNTRVNRGNPAIAVLSAATGLSALAPAQRAGAQRLCALAPNGLARAFRR